MVEVTPKELCANYDHSDRGTVIVGVNRQFTSQKAIVRHVGNRTWRVVAASNGHDDVAEDNINQMFNRIMNELSDQVRSVIIVPDQIDTEHCQVIFHLTDWADVNKVEACFYQALVDAFIPRTNCLTACVDRFCQNVRDHVRRQPHCAVDC